MAEQLAQLQQRAETVTAARDQAHETNRYLRDELRTRSAGFSELAACELAAARDEVLGKSSAGEGLGLQSGRTLAKR